MYLYLIQHAEAKSKEKDPERGLTESGKKTMERISDFFSRLKPEIYVIWHSGKKRAEQTAEILAASLGLKNRLITHTNLGPGDDISPVKKKIEKTKKNNIAIVGHLPYLNRLASILLSGDETRDMIRFRNAGIVCLVRDDTGWKLSWMLTPDLLA